MYPEGCFVFTAGQRSVGYKPGGGLNRGDITSVVSEAATATSVFKP